MSETLVPSWLKRAQPGNDVALALGVALLLVVLIVPLPVLLRLYVDTVMKICISPIPTEFVAYGRFNQVT